MNNKQKINNCENKNVCVNYDEDKCFSRHNNSQLLKKYIHDIRNSKTFTIDILKNINDFPYEDRMEIFIAYNDMMAFYILLVENEK